MSIVLFFGYLAGFLTTISLVPQVINMWKSKSVDDFSLTMLLIWCTGIACWVAYGILEAAKPIIFWNLGTLVLAGSILVMKIKYTDNLSHETKPIIKKETPIKDLKDWGV